MSQADLKEAFALIDSATTHYFRGPQSESLVATAEAALGLRFPPTYKTFLKRYGSGSILGFEVYGLTTDNFVNASVPNGIWLTLDERRTANAPHSLVMVTDTGDGGYYAIDLSKTNSDGDSPVIEWWPGADDMIGNGRVVAEDFGAFLLERVRWALSD